MITLIADNQVFQPPTAGLTDGQLTMSHADAAPIVGSQSVASESASGDRFNLSQHSEQAERPLLSDRSGNTWALGASAAQRGAQLSSLQAPDFSLSDLNGTRFSLSEFRGRKVFLVSWSSW